MQKTLFAFTALGFATVLAPVGSQKVEAAPIPAAMIQSSPNSAIVLAEWNEPRSYRRSWLRRDYSWNRYGQRSEGYRYRQNDRDRDHAREVYGERRGYGVR